MLAVVVEDDGFEEAAGSVSADVEVAVALIEHADGVAYRVLDVEITDAMFTGVVRDLHGCRLACPGGQGKLPCHPTGSAARRRIGERASVVPGLPAPATVTLTLPSLLFRVSVR